MDNKELERLAQEELLQEAKRAKSRAEEMGPMGWQRCPLPATNKRFLRNVLVSTLEPRKKKSRQAEPTCSETKEKVQNRTVHKDRHYKNTATDQKKSADKERHKHHKHKSRHKRSKP
ncbi:protein POLR1D-like isoform X2 [Oculina patagonica]